MNKPIPYNKVKIIIKEGILFRDPVLNKFLAEDGGVPEATMIALAGTSGAGKTTLCKKLQKELDPKFESVFFSLETSKNSVARQTGRVETHDGALVCDDTTYPTWSAFMEYLYADKPKLAIVDSLQHAAKLLSKENGLYKYANYATIVEDLYTWKEKTQGIVIMIVQLNGEGKVEGPEATVFDVDIPLKLIADPKTKVRHLEASKNRNGGTVGTPIFYEFVADDRVIQFFEADEYKVLKQGVSLTKMVDKALESFIKAYVSHDSYGEFKEEWVKGYNKVYNQSETNLEVTTKSLQLLTSLSQKYFTV